MGYRDRSTREDSIEADDQIRRAAALAPISSIYKVLGLLDDPSGVGVLGQNDASSGTPIGVQGAVPNAGGGYGLETPDDARVEGDLESTSGHRLTVGGNRALRLDPESGNDAGNVVAGHSLNTVKDGAVGAVLLGGGQDSSSVGVDDRNVVTDDYGVVVGGKGNVAGSDDDDDPSTARFATVGGGEFNRATGERATIGGGNSNRAFGGRSTVGGGYSNEASGAASTVAGGSANKALKNKATAGGGQGNKADADYATVAGGYANRALGARSTVGGGYDIDVEKRGGTAGGGEQHAVEGRFATVAGGGPSDTTDVANTNNRVHDDYGTIGGGGNNRAGKASTSGTTNGIYATIPGGRNNTADGAYSFAAGRNADTNGYDGAFVFADSTSTTVKADAADEAFFQMPVNGQFSNTSSRTEKTDIEPVDPGSVLDAVDSLEISTWEYTNTDDSRHMGPMAEAFHDAFGLGRSKKRISTVDADGVALAAIQGLAERLEDARDDLEVTSEQLADAREQLAGAREEMQAKDERIGEQADRIDDLAAANEALRARLAALEAEVGGGQAEASVDD